MNISFDITEENYIKILTFLIKKGAYGLVAILEASKDLDYTDSSSDTESDEEEEYEVLVDTDGFYSLR